MVRPRYEEASSEAYEMLAKAQELLKKADKIDLKKGEHHKETTFDTRPGEVQFVSESGGQTFNAQYQTNQSLLDADDVANKGASSSSVDMDMESSRRNPHDSVDRLVEG